MGARPGGHEGRKGNMDYEAVYSFQKPIPKKEPKPRGIRFTGVKIRDRWNNVYSLYPIYAKNWEALCKEMREMGYEPISYDFEAAP